MEMELELEMEMELELEMEMEMEIELEMEMELEMETEGRQPPPSSAPFVALLRAQRAPWRNFAQMFANATPAWCSLGSRLSALAGHMAGVVVGPATKAPPSLKN
jgi:hypothetical protein